MEWMVQKIIFQLLPPPHPHTLPPAILKIRTSKHKKGVNGRLTKNTIKGQSLPKVASNFKLQYIQTIYISSDLFIVELLIKLAPPPTAVS